MNAYVGVTDRDWFDFLSNEDGVDEVNFWQPNPWGGRFGVVRRGEPFLFKLKAPINAIAGGGFFEYYADLPMSLADACLVRMTETLSDPLLLTTDSDFRIYRRHSRQIIPCVMP